MTVRSDVVPRGQPRVLLHRHTDHRRATQQHTRSVGAIHCRARAVRQRDAGQLHPLDPNRGLSSEADVEVKIPGGVRVPAEARRHAVAGQVLGDAAHERAPDGHLGAHVTQPGPVHRHPDVERPEIVHLDAPRRPRSKLETAEAGGDPDEPGRLIFRHERFSPWTELQERDGRTDGTAAQVAGQWIPAPDRVRGRLCAGMTRATVGSIAWQPPRIPCCQPQRPLATAMASPVMLAAPCVHRNSTAPATSSGVTPRLMGWAATESA